MNLHYAKSEVERSRDAADPHTWPRNIAEDWLELRAKLERLQEYEQRAVQLWRAATPDPTDDLAESALCEFIAWVDQQLEKEQAAEAQKK